MLTTFATVTTKPKANEVWISEDGIAYTVVSNKISVQRKGTATGRADDQMGSWVEAITFDLSADNANGKLGGKRCHWVKLQSDDFAEKFQKQ